jgi:hypothetical protein
MKLLPSALVVSNLGAVANGASSLPLYNFTQLVYHDGSSNATFQQRYQLDTSHFRPGGPILFLQGAENVPGIEATPLDHFDFYDHAVELGGIAVAIEHRFFGTSFPPDFDGSAASYALLTLENVLADSVVLAEWVRNNTTGAETSPIFIEGGESAFRALLYPWNAANRDGQRQDPMGQYLPQPRGRSILTPSMELSCPLDQFAHLDRG